VSGSSPDASTSQAALIARGKYLVDITGCSDCHTPWNVINGVRQPDETLSLSGHPEATSAATAPNVATPAAPWTVSVRTLQKTGWSGAWGLSYAVNLTPDPDTGWLEGLSDKDFINVMRTGKDYSTQRVLSLPMLYVTWRIAKATDDDLKAMFAYLRSLKPMKNKVPDYVPPPPDAGT
jgi:hypothetical protein